MVYMAYNAELVAPEDGMTQTKRTMNGILAALLGVILSVLPATAASHRPPPQFTTLDACSLKGRGLTIAGGDVCLEVTGGVSYTQVWGNAHGGQGTDEGQVIVTTPDGVSTIPTPR